MASSNHVKAHPKVAVPAKIITAAMKNTRLKAAATGACEGTEAGLARASAVAATTSSGQAAPTGVATAGGPARQQAAAAAQHIELADASGGAGIEQIKQRRSVNFGPDASDDDEEEEEDVMGQPLSQRGRKWQQQQLLKSKLLVYLNQ